SARPPARLQVRHSIVDPELRLPGQKPGIVPRDSNHRALHASGQARPRLPRNGDFLKGSWLPAKGRLQRGPELRELQPSERPKKSRAARQLRSGTSRAPLQHWKSRVRHHPKEFPCRWNRGTAAGARRPGWPLRQFHLAHTSAEYVRPPSRDRKSTRLNSSHVKISYAVFCLK